MQLTQLTPSVSAQNFSVFKFNDSDLRVFDRNGDPWFAAADIATIFNIANIRKRLDILDEDERCSLKLQRGGTLTIVSESGMWTLVLRSDAALEKGTPAYKARKWVTSEVLPAIRKTGQYSTVREDRTVDTLTPEQQYELKEAVKSRAKKSATNYQTIYRAIYARYKIARYEQLPQEKLEDCLNFIKTLDLRVPEQSKPVTPNRYPAYDADGCCPYCGLKPIPEGSKILTKEHQRALFAKIKPLLDDAEQSMRIIEKERCHAWTCYHELRLLLIGIC